MDVGLVSSDQRLSAIGASFTSRHVLEPVEARLMTGIGHGR